MTSIEQGWGELRHLADAITRFLQPAQKRQLLFVSAWAGAFSLLEMFVAAMIIPYVQCLGGECADAVLQLSEAVGLQAIPLLTLSLFALVTLKLAVEAGLAWHAAGLNQQVQRSTVMQLLGAYLHLDWPSFQRQNRTHYYRRCATTAVDAAYACSLCIHILSASLVIVCLTALMIWQNPTASLTLIAGFTLVSMVSHRFIARAQKRAALTRESAMQRWNLGMAEAFASFREIRVYRMEAFFLSHIDRATRTLSANNRKLAFFPVLPRIVMDFGVLTVLLGVVSVWLLIGRPIADLLPQLIFYAVVARTLLPAMMQLASNRAAVHGAAINIELVLDELTSAQLAHTERIGIAPTPAVQPAFRLHAVRFSHGEQKLLEGVELDLAHPGWVAITGPSGVGKSTLMELLCGIRQPQGGQVIHAWPTDMEHPAPRIAYVPQHVALLDGTITDNIVFGFDDGAPERIARAIDDACLADTIRSLSEGVDTSIGPDGTMLSGGQRQRLAIARALYRDPDLLLLDEATSGLDEATEIALLQGLRRARPQMSLVLITHRESSLRFVDKVLRLENSVLHEISR